LNRQLGPKMSGGGFGWALMARRERRGSKMNVHAEKREKNKCRGLKMSQKSRKYAKIVEN
jgi:hypothetical protein